MEHCEALLGRPSRRCTSVHEDDHLRGRDGLKLGQYQRRSPAGGRLLVAFENGPAGPDDPGGVHAAGDIQEILIGARYVNILGWLPDGRRTIDYSRLLETLVE
jgi:hypothetical protein